MNFVINKDVDKFSVRMEVYPPSLDGDLELDDLHLKSFNSLIEAEKFKLRCEMERDKKVIQPGLYAYVDRSDIWNTGLVLSAIWTPKNELYYVMYNNIPLIGAEVVLIDASKHELTLLDNIEHLGYEIAYSDGYNQVEDWVLMRNLAEETYEIFSKDPEVESHDPGAPILFNKGQRLVFVKFEKL